MSALHAPEYLHLSPPVEDNLATLTWPRVPGAEEYEVECIYDATFDDAHTGGRWSDLHDETYTWWDLLPDRTWSMLHAKSTDFGLLWAGLHGEDVTWAAAAAADRDWAGCHGLPLSYRIYRGPGIPLDTRQPDTTWAYLHERSISWQAVRENGRDWYAIHDPAFTAELSLPVPVPMGKKAVCLRIRSYDQTGVSGWTASELHAVTPLAFREDSLLLFDSVDGGDRLLQLDGRCLGGLPGLELTLEHSPYHYDLVDAMAHLGYGMDLGATAKPVVRGVRTAKGGIRLAVDPSREGGDRRTGLLAALRLRPARTGYSTVNIH